MNKKYLIGFELHVTANNDNGKEAKISFDFIQNLREFLMDYFKVSLIKFEEREEVYMYVTMNPKEVPLISTGEDKITCEMVENFEEMYSEFHDGFHDKYNEDTSDDYIFYSVNPVYFILKHGEVVVYRNLLYNLEVYKGLDGTIIWGDFNQVFASKVAEYESYRRRNSIIEDNTEITEDDIDFNQHDSFL